MPTLSPEPHRHRQIAESFGTDPARYDRARPLYPPQLIDRVVATSPGTAVLDIGCGTGIASRQFRAKGCHVLGVDPDERMAERARQLGTDAEVATFETWDPAGRTFDAAIAAQAWHWVDPDAGAGKVARLLRPNGVFAVFWHAFHPPQQVAEALAEAFQRAVANAPFGLPTKDAKDGNDVLTTRVIDGIHRAAAFAEPEQARYETDLPYTRDAYLDLLPTTGAMTRLPPDKLAGILDAVGAAMDGTFTLHLQTVALFATKI